MANGFLVLVPHKTLHGTISILIQRSKPATNVGQMGAVKNKLPYIPQFPHEKEARTCPMCAFKLNNPGLPAELWDAFDSDDGSEEPVEDEHHAIFNCPGYMYAREQFQDLFQSHITTVS